MKQIDPDHPIWEVDFSLPDIEWQQKDDYVQEGLEMTNLRHELFCPVQEDYLKWLDAWASRKGLCPRCEGFSWHPQKRTKNKIF